MVSVLIDYNPTSNLSSGSGNATTTTTSTEASEVVSETDLTRFPAEGHEVPNATPAPTSVPTSLPNKSK